MPTRSTTRKGFGAKPRRRSTGSSRRSECSIPNSGVYGRWFVGGVYNTCWNAVDRHAMQGRGEQPAIIYNSPLTGEKRTFTYRALQGETEVLAGILRDFGVEKDDRVVLYMPMVPEAAIGMLACARIGAVHSVVFDAGAFWRVIAEHQCVAMFTAPTAFRAIKKEDPQGKFFGQYDLTRFRTLFLAGERADPDTLAWAENLGQVGAAT